MNNQPNQKPIDTIRDGALKAAIWSNMGEKGKFYSVSFSRTYLENEQYRDSNSYSGSALLKLSRLAAKAYDRVSELRAADRLAEET